VSDNLTPYDNRECPIYGREIDGELCYESALCLAKFFKVSSVPELSEINDIEGARKICNDCPCSNME
jgi:hypothetical protein